MNLASKKLPGQKKWLKSNMFNYTYSMDEHCCTMLLHIILYSRCNEYCTVRLRDLLGVLLWCEVRYSILKISSSVLLSSPYYTRLYAYANYHLHTLLYLLLKCHMRVNEVLWPRLGLCLKVVLFNLIHQPSRTLHTNDHEAKLYASEWKGIHYVLKM